MNENVIAPWKGRVADFPPVWSRDTYTKIYSELALDPTFENMLELYSKHRTLILESPEETDRKHTQDRIKLAEAILNKNGVETGYESMDASLRTFVDNGYDNWSDVSIDVVWRGSVSEVTPSTNENHADVAGREISINSPQLVMKYSDDDECSGVSIPANFKTAIGGGNYASIDPNPYDYSRNPTTADTVGWRFYNRPPEAV